MLNERTKAKEGIYIIIINKIKESAREALKQK